MAFSKRMTVAALGVASLLLSPLAGLAPAWAADTSSPSIRAFGANGALTDRAFVPTAPGHGLDLAIGEFRVQPKTSVVGRRADLLLGAEIDPPPSSGRGRAANPDIAVGPDDILVVAGQNRIMRIPNPNATGVALPYTAPTAANPAVPSPLANLNALRAGVATSEIALDTWIGATVLNDICGGSYDPGTCLIQHPTVRYDQMHGHFLVAFTVTDTGVRGLGTSVSAGRASTWVLLVSRDASFVRPDGTVPAQVFSTPVSPPPTAVGFTADWYIYYGSRNTAGPTGFLNLNMYSTHPTALPLSAPGRYSAAFPETNCGVPVAQQPPLSVSAPAGEETLCLVPTEVRIGIDHDSVILVSPVQNANQIVLNSNTIPFTTGRYAGNRVRVLSKFQLYRFEGSFQNGTWFVPGAYAGPRPHSGDRGSAGGLAITAPSQTQFDMFRNTDLPANCSVFDFASDTCTTTVAGFPNRRYTLGIEVSPTGSGIDTPRPPANPSTSSSLFPLYYEPVHLRGRAYAKYSNYPYGGVTHLFGTYALGTNAGQGGNGWLQPIVYRPDYRPALDAGDQAAIGISGPRRQLMPDTAINPIHAPQDVSCATPACSPTVPTDPANLLFVGDSRPRRAIHREGHVYTARTGRPASNIYGGSIITPPLGNVNTANPPLNSTVYHDVIQNIYTSAVPPLPAAGSTSVFTLPLANPSLIFYAFWQNGHFYSPMFDVPASVQLAGVASPSFVLPFLEKLFVGTTSPRVLAPNTSAQDSIWPSLFDIRQGIDKYDRLGFFTDPASGRLNNPLTSATPTNLLSTRHGGAVDPNSGGLWTYGAFADTRSLGVGQWATHAAYYDVSSTRVDPYGTPVNVFADVCPVGQGTAGCPESGFFPYIQMAGLLGVTQHLAGPGGQPLGLGVPPGHGFPGTALNFEPNRRVTRAEMAALLVYSMMDEAAVDDYLAKTTPVTLTDVFVGASGTDGDGFPVVLSDRQVRAIQFMARRGITLGCTATQFCPFAFLTRAAMAAFVMRAKFNNVHPTLLTGCAPGANPATCVVAGDNFYRMVETTPYFPVDVPTSHQFFREIQALRTLRITTGTSATTFSPAADLLRAQIATFLMRAFHF